MDKRTFLLAGTSVAAGTILAGCTTTGSAPSDPAARRASINSAVDRALSDLNKQVQGSGELVSKARGVLVFPNFVQAGFIVGGGSGEGALREGGSTTSFHRMTTASVGWLAGAQSVAIIYLFNTTDALARFKASSGWAGRERVRVDQRRSDGQPEPRRLAHHPAGHLGSTAAGPAPGPARRRPHPAADAPA